MPVILQGPDGYNSTIKMTTKTTREKNTYYKVRPVGDNDYWVVTGATLGLEIEDWLDNNGGKLVIKTVKMTEEEFNNLPEYEG